MKIRHPMILHHPVCVHTHTLSLYGTLSHLVYPAYGTNSHFTEVENSLIYMYGANSQIMYTDIN